MKRTPLWRSTKPMSKVSKKQAAINRELALYKTRLIVTQIEEHGHTYCELCGQQTPQVNLELVHKRGRGRGGPALDPANLCLGCRSCHYGPLMGDHYNEPTTAVDNSS